jgi:ferredoxin-NADP reductase
MKARIQSITTLSPTIKRILLAPAEHGLFPTAAAGAHIIVSIPGPARVWKNAYSLVSKPDDRAHYEIIVRRVTKSRGGSAWLHDHAAVGQALEISLPANLFPIAKPAARHLLLSAGIGVTPFLSYMPVLRAANAAFELHHCCKLSDAEAFAALLPAADNITIHTSRNTLGLAALLAAQKLNTHLYVCGPEDFMDAVVDAARRIGWPESKLHLESFGGATGGAPFTVRLARSGRTINVGPEESLLEALEAAGLQPPCLCRGGACGECELPVLGGVPDHHDHFLSAEKRAAGSAIMTCVSRAKTPELLLDF